MTEQKKVYIGHGPCMEGAAGIGISLNLSLGIGDGLADERGYLVRGDPEIGKILNITEMFVIYSGCTSKLFSVLRDKKSEKSNVLHAKEYSIGDLKKYLERDIGSEEQIITDHIIVTTDDLVEIVKSEVEKLGCKPITFN